MLAGNCVNSYEKLPAEGEDLSKGRVAQNPLRAPTAPSRSAADQHLFVTISQAALLRHERSIRDSNQSA